MPPRDIFTLYKLRVGGMRSHSKLFFFFLLFVWITVSMSEGERNSAAIPPLLPLGNLCTCSAQWAEQGRWMLVSPDVCQSKVFWRSSLCSWATSTSAQRNEDTASPLTAAYTVASHDTSWSLPLRPLNNQARREMVGS